MATRYRLENAGVGAVEWGGSGAQLGYMFGGPKGAAIGGAIGGFAGILKGLLSPTEEQELIDRMKRGEIDPEQERRIVQALKRRFYGLRQAQGQSLARRGLTDSSIAARLDADLIRGEGEAVAEQLARISSENRETGYDMMARRAADRQQAVAAAAQGLGSIYLLERQNKQAAAAEKRWQDHQNLLAQIYARRSSGVSQRPASGRLTGAETPLSGMSSVRNRSTKPKRMIGESAFGLPSLSGY